MHNNQLIPPHLFNALIVAKYKSIEFRVSLLFICNSKITVKEGIYSNTTYSLFVFNQNVE